MTFLAPWAMALGALGAATTLLLHLVARHQPAAWVLPTARFIPERHALVSRAAARPRDLLLLAVRMLLLLLAGAAFARPVFTGTRAPRGRVVLLDRTPIVADSADARRRALTLVDVDLPSVLVEFGDEMERAGDGGTAGALSAGLVAARRGAAALAREADSVELVIVSPLAATEADDATWTIRALWRGRIRAERVPARRDSTPPIALERAVPVSDVLGPALVRTPVRASPTAVRLRRTPGADAADSAFARGGGTVVLWPSSSAPPVANAVALGDDVVVAPFARMALPVGGRVSARWADGSAAARDGAVGAGCIRSVGIGVPAAGDVALRPAFQRIVRGLVAPCVAATRANPMDSAQLARLAGAGPLASGPSLDADDPAPSRIVPWLLGGALACALAELALRRRPSHGIEP